MRITIITVGSRGDVQPYLALGLGLRDAGHAVRLATHGEFEASVRERGLDFAPLSGNPRAMLESEVGQRWLESQSNPIAFVRRWKALAEPILWDLFRDALRATDAAELIVASTLGLFAAGPIAEHRGIRHVIAPLQPLVPTRAVTSSTFPPAPHWLPFEGLYNRFSYAASQWLIWQVFGPTTNAIRREMLGLPPLRSSDWQEGYTGPILHGFSRHVIPRPPDWEPRVKICGYWFLDTARDYTPPADLLAFLENGPPISIGFGSMTNRDPERTARLVLDAVRQSGQRAVLLTGWGAIRDLDWPDTVYRADAIPHDWLFPRLAAVVHHGGAGTTAAGLRAGVPSIVIPFFADQPFWADRVRRLGVGPTPIPRQRLTADRLADAIRQAVTDDAMKRRAADLGALIRAENGVANAVAEIDRALARPA